MNEITIETLKSYVEEATDNYDARQLQRRDRDYYDSKQWTSEEVAELNKRKQPVVTENLIKPKIDNLMGMERQSRTDPKAFPRTPGDEDAAEAATDAIRFVLDNNDFDYTRSDFSEDLFIEGESGAIVEEKDGEIEITHIPWDRLIKDRHSRRRDGKDAKYLGLGAWMDYDDAIRTYGKEHADKFSKGSEGDSLADEMDDRPQWSWFEGEGNRKRCFVVDLYHLDGKWMRSVFTGGGIIYQGESRYKDETGEPRNPIETGAAFIDRDNNVYGIARQLISIQDEINKRRSKLLHFLNSRQTVSEVGAFDDVNEMKRELNKPDGHLTKNRGFEFDILPNGDLAGGQFNLLSDSRDVMNSVGANDAISGKAEGSSSGRAIQARQQAGVLELGPVFDSIRSWQKRVYRQVWLCVQQFWTEERWIRVTDDEKNIKFVGLNQPVTNRQVLEEEGTPIPPDMVPGSPTYDPRLEMVAEIKNPVAELDVDIILEDAPDLVNLQSEQFDLLAQMYQANPNAIPFDMVIAASGLRNKDQLIERLTGGGEQTPEQQQQAQVQQQQQMEAMQIQKAGAIADVEATTAKAAKDNADAEAQQLENMAIKNGMDRLIQIVQGANA